MFYRIFFIILLFNSIEVFSIPQDSLNQNTKNISNRNDEKSFLCISFTKRAFIQEDNSNDFMNQPGNNYFGLTLSRAFVINSKSAFGLIFKSQIGSNDGITTSYFSLIPDYYLLTDYINVNFGTGLAVLYTGPNKQNDWGITSIIGLNADIYHGLGVYLDFGIDFYAKKQFKSISIGLTYGI